MREIFFQLGGISHCRRLHGAARLAVATSSDSKASARVAPVPTSLNWTAPGAGWASSPPRAGSSNDALRIYRGGPDPAFVRTIHEITEADERDRLYFRRIPGGPLRRLKRGSYAELNAILDRLRPAARAAEGL
jgi:hypothetical protein